jgi:hypothetical protein
MPTAPAPTKYYRTPLFNGRVVTTPAEGELPEVGYDAVGPGTAMSGTMSLFNKMVQAVTMAVDMNEQCSLVKWFSMSDAPSDWVELTLQQYEAALFSAQGRMPTELEL